MCKRLSNGFTHATAKIINFSTERLWYLVSINIRPPELAKKREKHLSNANTRANSVFGLRITGKDGDVIDRRMRTERGGWEGEGEREGQRKKSVRGHVGWKGRARYELSRNIAESINLD